MTVYSFISLILIAVMAVFFGVIFVNSIVLGRDERIRYVRSFKNGKFILIYLISIPLFIMAFYYAKNDFASAFLASVTSAIELVGLSFQTESIALLCKDDIFFKIAIIGCYAMVLLNVVMFILSFLHQWIWVAFKRFGFTLGNKSKCLIIGNGEGSEEIYNSSYHKKLLVGEISSDDQSELFINGVAFKAFKEGEDGLLLKWLFNTIERETKKFRGSHEKLNIIINLNSDSERLLLCGKISDFLKDKEKDIAQYFDVYVFGNREYEDVYAKYEKSANGCIHYVNKHVQIATDFIENHPITSLMDEKHIDYNTSLIKKEADINVLLVGFGKANQQTLVSMVANNQFLTEDDGGNITEKKINYHVFDKSETNEHKNLNHNYFNFSHAFYCEGKEINGDGYFHLPNLPAKENYHFFDVNEYGFWEELRASLGEKRESINCIIVAIGNDYESVDVTNKINEKITEWGILNCRLFTRIHDKKILNDSNIIVDAKTCEFFGADEDVVYSYPHIIHETLTEIAIMRNYIYDIERDKNKVSVSEDEKEISRRKWYTKLSPVLRLSNEYACLNLRSKLNLMGLDCVRKEDDGVGLLEQEYLDIYAKDDMPIIRKDGKGIEYPLEYKKSRRTLLAMQEHSRWNAFMITQGFLPAKVEDVKYESDVERKEENGKTTYKIFFTNGKNLAVRRHGNLTDFDSLIDFRRSVSSPCREGGDSEKDSDVIKYDFQLLDGAWWLLNQNGYKIVKIPRVSLEKIDESDWDGIYKEMTESFVLDEIRDEAEAKKTLKEKEYAVYHVLSQDKKVGFVALWELEGFTFVEHFVIYKEFRNKGYGSLALDALKNSYGKIVLEIEPPEDKVSRKRLDFYQNKGFKPNAVYYEQPSYREGGNSIRMYLMSYPYQLGDPNGVIKRIYQKVYKKFEED